MKKQSGFTLIELLLVLAIIGIISAIAIPALLSQRARARDKAGISNMVSMIDDGVGQYDKAKEKGLASAAITTSLNAYLAATHPATKDKNPWNTAAGAYIQTFTAGTAGTKSAFLNGMTAGSLGTAKMYIAYPTSTLGGWIGGIVKVQNTIDGSLTVRKATAIE
ncbi:MAG: prepilin-type N-terminal cleavage/methylation domain-containing protein [Holophagaceae bacterium]|nr:prepilin-type N-terminal cleavage/methylation domain-containing protein [Holophagaceae bacterium]